MEGSNADQILKKECVPSAQEEKKIEIKIPALFYDDKCILCTRFKQALERLPGTDQINMVSVYDEKIYSTFPHLKKEECLKEIHLIDDKGQTLKGAQVVTFLIERFPGVEKFAWLLESNMGQKAIEFFHKTADLLRKELQSDCPHCNKHG